MDGRTDGATATATEETAEIPNELNWVHRCTGIGPLSTGEYWYWTAEYMGVLVLDRTSV